MLVPIVTCDLGRGNGKIFFGCPSRVRERFSGPRWRVSFDPDARRFWEMVSRVMRGVLCEDGEGFAGTGRGLSRRRG